jgi:hypothetical protein
MPISQIPPKVNVPDMNVNATISRGDGTLLVKIDAEYIMHSVYAYGDSYLAQNTGMGLVADPSPFVKVIVTQDTLEAHYPIPSDAANISVSVDGKEVKLQTDSHGYFHIFDVNLPEINWTISPVLRDFKVVVHYEQPISKTTEAYAYLGDYTFVLPMYGRYGCSNISYPLYSWYGYPPTEYNIQIEPSFSKMQVYFIDSIGTLTPLNSTSQINSNANRIGVEFVRKENSSSVHGMVVAFNVPAEDTEFLPVTLFVAVFIIIAVVIGIRLYLKKGKPSNDVSGSFSQGNHTSQRWGQNGCAGNSGMNIPCR